jgi:transcriptional regulator with XRE-family HTH domain
MKLAKTLLLDHPRALAGQGLTLRQAAEATGMTYSYLCILSNKHGIEFTRQRMAERPAGRARAQEMRSRYESGQTLEQIGAAYGLTRERVRQIMNKKFGTTGRDGGQAENARRKRREKYKQRDARCLRVWGCTYRQYVTILKHEDKPTYAYWAQRKNALRRSIPWELNLWQWWTIWQKSGHWPERGRGRAYQMCRLNDLGPYSVDNVYIATGVENMQDHWVNRRARAVQQVVA